jgi:hypothetical protein
MEVRGYVWGAGVVEDTLCSGEMENASKGKGGLQSSEGKWFLSRFPRLRRVGEPNWEEGVGKVSG